MRRLILLPLFLCLTPLFASEPARIDSTLAPKVYIDGDFWDMNYIRTEITFVNYVIDRKEADIHILISRVNTGSGGRDYSLFFMGGERYSGKTDTLHCITLNDDTDDLRREKVVKTIKIGLLPYLTDSPLIDDIDVNYSKTKDVMVKEDKWNNWLFTIRLNTWLSGEKLQSRNNYSIRLQANRITEGWKQRFRLNQYYYKDRYTYEDEDIVSEINRSFFYGLIVKSLNDHWSIGISNEIISDTYRNYDLHFNIAPAIEYNIYPYSEVARREWRLLYRVGYSYNKYEEETIYEKNEEGLVKHSLSSELEFKQPWGELEFGLTASQYLHDLAKNRLSIDAGLELKLFKGFSINLWGYFSMLHDQLGIRKRDADIEEVLLHRRELETNYTYHGSIGFTYRFGSMFNNIVNPRFGG